MTGLSDGWVVPDSSLVGPDVHCTRSVPEFSGGSSSFGGTVCSSQIQFLRMAWNQAVPLVRLKGWETRLAYCWEGEGGGEGDTPVTHLVCVRELSRQHDHRCVKKGTCQSFMLYSQSSICNGRGYLAIIGPPLYTRMWLYLIMIIMMSSYLL